MLLSAPDAKRFITTYERLAMAVHAVAKLEPPANPMVRLARAREQLQQHPELLEEAKGVLKRQGTKVDAQVLEALRQMKLDEFVHLKDLKSGAIWISKDGRQAYRALGLTEAPSVIIGERGHVLETGLCPFAGKIVCDGVFLDRVLLGPNLWSEFHNRYLSLKAAGQLYSDPALVPGWQ